MIRHTHFSISGNTIECIVYLECLKKVGNNVFDVYIDFRQIKDLNHFVQSNPNNQIFNKIGPTYIELLSLKTNKRLLTGCYYKLNIDLLNRFDFVENTESLFIKRSYNLNNMQYPGVDTEEILQKHTVLDPQELFRNKINGQFTIEELHNYNLKLCVRDVGQANWNELIDNNIVKYVYDIGAELHSKIDDVKKLFYERVDDYKRDKPILVLSHWDIDHIQCMLYVDIQTIRDCFSKCICIDMMKTITSLKIYNNILKALGKDNVYCIRPADRTNGITMHLWNRIGNIAFYKGEKSRNINYAGLCMFVSGKIKSANFTGDIKLIQAKYVYDQEKEFNSNTENPGIGGGKEDNTQVENSKEDKNKSQMEIDAEFLKANYSFINPVKGTVTSRYGAREPTDIISANHYGIDIGASTGTEIIASTDGKVEQVSEEGEYGKHVKIRNGEAVTLYAHCSELLVKEGQQVKQGEKIALVGETGKATGPHLHFEIRRDKNIINPEYILKF